MITVVKPGLQTTVQDLGRYGFQRFGVLVNGAMDTYSHRLVNLLVGNEESAPTLEATIIGPHLRFEIDTIIAIGGADLTPAIDGTPIPLWRPHQIRRGQSLTFGAAKNGCRAYIAVAGGWVVPSVMNSAATYLRGKLGGFLGRSLQKGDQLQYGSADNICACTINTNWRISDELLPRFHNHAVIQVMRGQHFDLFSKNSQQLLFADAFEVTASSDRMGYRLKGPQLKWTQESEMLSEAVAFGTIQVPADGHPIILLADRQTTGGYPKIAQIASVDFSKIAQANPGDKITFKEICHNEAQLQFLQIERKLQYVKQGISHKVK